MTRRLVALAIVAVALVPVAVWQPFARHSGHKHSAALERQALATPHSSRGVFVGLSSGSAYRLEDDDRLLGGVVQHRYGKTFEFNPQQVATQGLWNFSHRKLKAAARQADWLVANQASQGEWLYRFDFKALPREWMRAPWPSAMAQGAAVALLARMWHATGAAKYRRAAVRALRVFHIPIRKGGVLRRWNGLPLYEEYPTPKLSGVLDGFLLSLVGLHDFADSRDAQRLYAAGLRTARKLVPAMDSGAGPEFAIAYPIIAPSGYHYTDVSLLAVLARLSHDPVLARYRDRWARTL